MSGIQEILLILLLILAIFVLPRIMGRGRTSNNAPPGARLPMGALSGRMRLALALSVGWPLLTAVYFKPWESGWLPYTCFGPGVVALCWCVWWVKDGFRRHRR